jgi:DNA polymerase-3 subunit delta
MARLNAEGLPVALAAGLKSAYLVSGDEPLLVGEAADAIRGAARAAGYAERKVFFIERGFDWQELHAETQALSLFSERRLIELRLPNGKPDKGAAQLTALATNPPPDVVTLVLTDKLDKKAADSPWVGAFAQRGVWVTVWPVKADALPAWLAARAKRGGMTLEPGAAALIAERVEGNLLAAAQEVEKLALLARGGRIDRDLVLASVGDSARYDVFQLAEAAAAGDAARALRILLGLKSEGVEPTLILWAIVRELRGLFQAGERQRLRSAPQGTGWNQASTPSAAALARVRTLPLADLLREAGMTDRIVKGLAAGDAWTALMGLTAGLAGALQPTGVSGRVVS